MNRLHSAIALILAMLILALPLQAQDSTPETPIVVDAPATNVPLDYGDFSQIGGIAAMVLLIVEIAKRVPVLRDFDPFKLNATLTLILYVGYQIVFIYGGDTGAYLGYLADVGHFGDAAWNLFLSFSGATGMYHTIKNTKGMLPEPPKPAQDL